jgi:ribosomal protein S6--L-glutamate ligase
MGHRLGPIINGHGLWVKDRGGSKGRGVNKITTVEGIEDPADPFGLPLPLYAQRNVPGSGRDLKIYVVGEQQWAITRPWPAVTVEDKLGLPAEIAREIRDLAFACGDAMGLEIFGVDFLIDGATCHIVDVNAFPGFKGIDAAPLAIAQHVAKRARS